MPKTVRGDYLGDPFWYLMFIMAMVFGGYNIVYYKSVGNDFAVYATAASIVFLGWLNYPRKVKQPPQPPFIKS